MRKLTIIGGTACAAAALALPSIASAHSVAVTCTNGTVTAYGSDFPGTPLVTLATLTVDGVPLATETIIPPIPGPSPVHTFTTPLYGQHVIVANFVNGGPWSSPATPVNCGEAPTPPPVIVPPPVETIPPANVVRIDKPIAIKRITKRPKQTKRAPYTCISFKRTHPTLGPRAYAKAGLRYYACHLPKQHVPWHVPVTG